MMHSARGKTKVIQGFCPQCRDWENLPSIQDSLTTRTPLEEFPLFLTTTHFPKYDITLQFPYKGFQRNVKLGIYQ